MTRGPDAVTALGAAVAGIGVGDASIDYMLHFPAIPIALAALLGAAVSVDGPHRHGAA